MILSMRLYPELHLTHLDSLVFLFIVFHNVGCLLYFAQYEVAVAIIGLQCVKVSDRDDDVMFIC